MLPILLINCEITVIRKCSQNLTEPNQKEAEMTRLITDLDNYKDVLQKTEARLGKKIKELTAQVNAKVRK